MDKKRELTFSESLFWNPEYLDSSAWLEHIPFAFWATNVLKPNVFVELGTFSGVSYFAFCQAIDRLNLNCKAYAVDTWKGDKQAGFYVESVYQQVLEYNNSRFSSFSTLLRCTFDDALAYFNDKTIDILHIDGYHVYESVKHDFETWLPKLSERGVVLLHDTNVRKGDFGVFRLFEELKSEYKTFEFFHGYGLGLVVVGDVITEELEFLFGDEMDQARFRDALSQLGKHYYYKQLHNVSKKEVESFELENQKIIHSLNEQKAQSSILEEKIVGLTSEAKQNLTEIDQCNAKIEQLQKALDEQKAQSSILEEKIVGLTSEAKQNLTETDRYNVKIEQLQVAVQEAVSLYNAEKVKLDELKTTYSNVCAENKGLSKTLCEVEKKKGEIENRFTSAVKNADAAIAKQSALLKQKTDEVKSLRKNLRSLTTRHDRTMVDLQYATQSTSWKITEPLRAIRKSQSRLKRLANTDSFRSNAAQIKRVLTPGLRQSAPHSIDKLRWLRHKNRLKGVVKGGLTKLHRGSNHAHEERKAYDEALILCEAGLFSCGWYLDQYPDVERSGLHPAYHYAHWGWKEDRNPHPLFDCIWYKRQFSVPFGINPLLQYHRTGWKEGKSPHPLFDGKWYLEEYSDVAKGSINPLEHYLKIGWKEGRKPNKDFDVHSYLKGKSTGEQDVNALVHSLLSGKVTMNRQSMIAGDSVLPDQLKSAVTVVVVVGEDGRNILPTLQHIDVGNYSNGELVFLWPGLETFPKKLIEEKVGLRNYRVIDYSRTSLLLQANETLKSAKGEYVVFMRTDVQPSRGWLERLIECHEAREKIRVVDVLANSARSFELQIKDVLDCRYTDVDFALLVETFSRQQYPEVPAVNSGCCFCVQKSVISDVGLFDATKQDLFGDVVDEFTNRIQSCEYEVALADNVMVVNSNLPDQREEDLDNQIILDSISKRYGEIEIVSYLKEKAKSYVHVSEGKKYVVYTAIIGDYDDLKEPAYIHKDVDYVCYTDNPNIKSDVFTVKRIEKVFARDIKNARMLKVLSHLFFVGYEYCLWIDGSTRIRGLDFKDIIHTYLVGNPIALHKHIKRNCIYQEAKECLLQTKDDSEAISRQVNYLTAKKYPKQNGLVETAQVMRRLEDTNRKFNSDWWYFVDTFSIRDQLSFNYVAWKNQMKYSVIPENAWCDQYFKTYLHGVKDFSKLNHNNSVSLVMLVHNALDITKVSIESILDKTRYPNFELIVVDNDSDEKTKGYLRSIEKEYKNIRIITNPENYSFSKGNNIGIRASDAEFVLLINNDVEIIDDNWLQILVDEIQSDSIVGAVGPMMLYPNYTVQSGSVDINVKNDSLVSSREVKTYRHSGYVDAVSAGCLLMPREFYWQLDGLDEQFIYGQEDIDLCIKIRKAKRAIKFVAHCEVVHHESYTRSFNEQTLKNRELIKAKWENRMGFFREPLSVAKAPKRYAEILKDNPLSYRSFSDMESIIRQNVSRFANTYDIVVGVPRSGMIPAYIIGNLINATVLSLDEFANEVKQTAGDRKLHQIGAKRGAQLNVLVVDDSINFGNAHKRVIKTLPETYLGFSCKYRHLAIYASDYHSNPEVDFLEIVKLPRLFQWNYKNHGIAQYACYDMDGVLCEDPTDEQNDDGAKYMDFIATAKPLYIPRYKIRAIATSRLEKYREQTKQWLKNHNVQYEELYMVDLPSKEERIRLKIHGKFKAKVYGKLNNTYLFVESNAGQAKEILKLTGKPVVCTADDHLYSN